MAKPTEKMLYGTFLDLYYAERDLGQHVEDLTETSKDLQEALKNAKKSHTKTKKLLAQLIMQYKSINGHNPTPPK